MEEASLAVLCARIPNFPRKREHLATKKEEEKKSQNSGNKSGKSLPSGVYVSFLRGDTEYPNFCLTQPTAFFEWQSWIGFFYVLVSG